jgi:hypothetical protein
MYTIQPGDTYISVSQSQQVATNDLIAADGLAYDPPNFPTSRTLCIRHQCSVYVVKQNDTCSGIASSNKLSIAEFRAWNPAINGLCSNPVEMVNRTLCLSNPLGDFLVSNNTGSATITTPAPIPPSVAPNTTTNCGQYRQVLPGDGCSSVSLKFNIPLKDFLFLDPKLNADCNNLWLDYSYCVAPVGETSTYPGYGGATSTSTITPETRTPLLWTDSFANNRTDTVAIPPRQRYSNRLLGPYLVQ